MNTRSITQNTISRHKFKHTESQRAHAHTHLDVAHFFFSIGSGAVSNLQATRTRAVSGVVALKFKFVDWRLMGRTVATGRQLPTFHHVALLFLY
jgi:hypothetical protein